MLEVAAGIAAVTIACEQLRLIFVEDLVDKAREFILGQLEERIAKHHAQNN